MSTCNSMQSEYHKAREVPTTFMRNFGAKYSKYHGKHPPLHSAWKLLLDYAVPYATSECSHDLRKNVSQKCGWAFTQWWVSNPCFTGLLESGYQGFFVVWRESCIWFTASLPHQLMHALLNTYHEIQYILVSIAHISPSCRAKLTFLNYFLQD